MKEEGQAVLQLGKCLQTASVLIANQRASGGVAMLITPPSGARPSSLFNYAGKLVLFF